MLKSRMQRGIDTELLTPSLLFINYKFHEELDQALSFYHAQEIQKPQNVSQRFAALPILESIQVFFSLTI